MEVAGVPAGERQDHQPGDGQPEVGVRRRCGGPGREADGGEEAERRHGLDREGVHHSVPLRRRPAVGEQRRGGQAERAGADGGEAGRASGRAEVAGDDQQHADQPGQQAQ